MEPTPASGKKGRSDDLDTTSCLVRELEEAREKEQTAIRYIREKINQLLAVMGTFPLRPEELDNETLLALDPIGIVSDSFAQVLDHLHTTNDRLMLARNEIQAIFDSAGAGILVLDGKMHIQAYNAKLKELFLGDCGDVLGRPCFEVICRTNDPDPSACTFRRILSEHGKASQSDWSLQGRHFSVEGTPIINDKDDISQVVIVYSEITELKKTAEALQNAETRLKTILNSVQTGILVIDAETHVIIDANGVAAKMTGYPPGKLIGSVCHDFICPAQRGECPCTDLRLCLDNSERELLTSTGRRVPILKTVTSVVLDGRSYLLESFIDITERKKADEALKASEDRYRMLVENQSDLVVKFDINGNMLFVSPSYCDMFGQTEEELLQKKFFSFMREDDHLSSLEVMKHLRTPPHTYAHESASLTRVGWRWLSWSYKAVFDEWQEVSAVFGIGRDITERKKAEDEIQKLAYYDTLTGLPNRTLLKDRLEQVLAQASRDKRRVGVIFLDLDRFKSINDTLGHAIGDKLLKKIAERLSETMRRSDTVARLGGDEFVIILSALSLDEDVTSVALKTLDTLSLPIVIDGHEVYTTGSIGIALYPMDGEDVDTLLKNADIAMYQAKDLGRSTYQFFSQEMNSKAVERLVLENSLRHALERGELFLHYQPQFDLETGRVTGCEALLRWQHPDLGLFSPSKFIPLAEETGLIIPIGEWVLRTACGQNKAWQDAGLPAVRMAVNLSGCQFKQANLIEMIKKILEESGLEPLFLELELTESTLMKNAGEAKKLLLELKKMGIHLAIDDFGTGYSSLSYLKHFPLDRLKIAQSFVHDITSDPDDAAIAEAIIAMARSLKLKVIAEGVEKADQLEFLRTRHCDEIQGYFLGMPLSAEEFAQLLDGGAQ